MEVSEPYAKLFEAFSKIKDMKSLKIKSEHHKTVLKQADAFLEHRFEQINVFRGCHRQPLYCFHFDFRYVTLVRYIYIYIICIPTHNRNNEFIL